MAWAHLHRTRGLYRLTHLLHLLACAQASPCASSAAAKSDGRDSLGRSGAGMRVASRSSPPAARGPVNRLTHASRPSALEPIACIGASSRLSGGGNNCACWLVAAVAAGSTAGTGRQKLSAGGARCTGDGGWRCPRAHASRAPLAARPRPRGVDKRPPPEGVR